MMPETVLIQGRNQCGPACGGAGLPRLSPPLTPGQRRRRRRLDPDKTQFGNAMDLNDVLSYSAIVEVPLRRVPATTFGCVHGPLPVIRVERFVERHSG